ncbi:MAG TPA: HEAT repeat domain-containing protein [Bacteroidales bacterium]|nr:HEAT repeat domain-containing protein [Bacteroidales bacterium]
MNPEIELPDDINPDELTEDVLAELPGLLSERTLKRLDARNKLIEKGNEILPQVYKLVDSKHRQLRWEAAQIVKAMASADAIPKLLSLLSDYESDIRWIAAEGLIELGRASLIPLLKYVLDHVTDPYIKNGAHHVLREVLNRHERAENRDLLHALNNYQETGETTPHRATELLNKLQSEQQEEDQTNIP